MSSPDGSAEQARALLQAVTDWVSRAMPAPPSGRPGPECEWCPLCQLASVLRGEHPELTDRLTEAGQAITGALRALGTSTAGSPSDWIPADWIPPGWVTTGAAPRERPDAPDAPTPSGATAGPASAAADAPRRRPRPRPRIDPDVADGTADHHPSAR